MLFRDFFPRLRDTAWERYGEVVTERQFIDWREDGLLPGPAGPVGRGRGRSPDRHWPIASYRRALRICRYKSWGARRQSQWWLGFWLSGEAVHTDVVRSALKREASNELRTYRSFVESNRWRNSTFETTADANKGGIPGVDVGQLLSILKMTPDQFRRVAILQLRDIEDGEDIELIHEIGTVFFDIEAELAAEIKSSIDPTDIKRIWRSGHMGEGIKHPGDYLDNVSALDIANARLIIQLREKAAIWRYAINWISGDRAPDKVVLYLIPILQSRASALPYRISIVLRIVFELYADRRDGIDANWRLEGEINSLAELRLTVEDIIGKLSNKHMVFPLWRAP